MAGRKSKTKKQTEKPSNDSEWVTPARLSEALDYKRQGHSDAAIAEAMELSVEQVQRLVTTALNQASNENLKDGIQLRIERLNLSLSGIMPSAASGEESAIRMMMQIEAEIARLKMLLVPDFKGIFQNRVLLKLAGLDYIEEKENGRPSHVPTEENCLIVDRMGVIGYNKEQISAVLGIHVDTFTKHYGHIYKTARPVAISRLATAFIDQAEKKLQKGDSSDARFTLSRLAPPEWKDAFGTPRQGDGPSNGQGAGSGNPQAQINHRIEIVGGLPEGSSSDDPGGPSYSEIPPEPE